MNKSRLMVFGIACALFGAVAQEGIAQVRKLSFTPDLLAGKSKSEKAAVLLDGAAVLAEGGSWELIAVGRAWYLGGDKLKGQALFDRVTTSKKVESSDWLRVGLVHLEAHETDKAKAAFDRALQVTAPGHEMRAQLGAMLIAMDDVARGEGLLNESMARHPRDFWGWTAAGGAYLGVVPML